jgi:hypothetical protein
MSLRRSVLSAAFCFIAGLGVAGLSGCTASHAASERERSHELLDVAWLARAQDEKGSTTTAPKQEPQSEEPRAEEPPPKEGRGLLVGVLLYLPNRLFDVLDVARVRLRVGPGLSAGLRATRPLNLAIGAHGALFLGLPGPRGEASIPWPVGLEDFAGAEISVVNGTRAGNVHYGLGEIGGGGQLLILGGEFGVDPWELVDFVVGLVTVDPVGDDF